MNIHRFSLNFIRTQAARWALGSLVFAFGLIGCGSGQFMASREPQDDLATVHPVTVPTPVVLAKRPLAGLRRRPGSTRSGNGMLSRVVVRPGDTLWKIAERRDVYGSGWLYPLIFKANRKKLPRPNRIPAGLILLVPRNVPDPEVEKAEEEAMTGQFLDQSPVPLMQPATPLPTPGPQPRTWTAQVTPLAKPFQPGFGWGGWIFLALLFAAGGLFAIGRLAGDDAETEV